MRVFFFVCFVFIWSEYFFLGAGVGREAIHPVFLRCISFCFVREIWWSSWSLRWRLIARLVAFVFVWFIVLFRP